MAKSGKPHIPDLDIGPHLDSSLELDLAQPERRLEFDPDSRAADVAAPGSSRGRGRQDKLLGRDKSLTPEILSGTEIIRQYAVKLPNRPGVYRMISAEGEVLYVGKAKDLKKRVTQYAQGRFHAHRIARMVRFTERMEFVLTQTETEALLLEANLIKTLKPRFNVLLRDDKSFPFILIRQDHASPALSKHRGARKAKGTYFGPFASGLAVNETLAILQKIFLLRTCSDNIFEARTRPCMLHQIKRCAAPCVDVVSPGDYQRLVHQAIDFLKGRNTELSEQLASEMEAASQDLQFEEAAKLRDRIRALAAIRASQDLQVASLVEADIFALHLEGGQSCIQVFFYRAGQNWGNRAYYPRHDRDAGASEILSAFIAQFYDDKPAPALILVSHELAEAELLSEALSLRAERRVEVKEPQRGEKRHVIDQALLNAREALGRKLAETGAQGQLLAATGEVFGLAQAPRRIEVYDNSHIMGAHAVGAMIVTGPEGFEKGQYRKFNMRADGYAPGDDYAMMRAMLQRRFTRLAQAQAEADQPSETHQPPPVWPDLILIDGGAGQLSVAHSVLEELGLAEEVALVAIAKGPDRDAGQEQFFRVGHKPFRLEPRSPVLYFLQRLRDEAHRFAIGAHRQKRSKAIIKNPLDEISGIGPGRKRALLNRFGSAKGVAAATLADLQSTPGIHGAMAERIHDFFNKGGFNAS